MNILIIGGTGLISTGIVKHLLARGADVTCFNRGERENTLPKAVRQVRGDRSAAGELERLAKAERFDVVIDMVCFKPTQCAEAIAAFGNRCDQFIFCSTVCTYGVKIPPSVLIDETFLQEPISDYGRNKLACEKLLLDAHAAGKFAVTIVRPSCTYGEGNSLIDNLEGHPATWDRIRRGLPVLCSGDGQGLWVATHRDDVGKLFAYACGNAKTLGQSYNATRDDNFTWRDYYREAAIALGASANVIFMPAHWIVHHDPARFGLLREITQFHGAYSSAKAKADVPEFRCDVPFIDGARRTFEDMHRRNSWRDGASDTLYNRMIDQAVGAGVSPVAI